MCVGGFKKDITLLYPLYFTKLENCLPSSSKIRYFYASEE